ncbi:MAG TPA: translation elongation factor Ts, partial [Dehalococcoidia bacterium]|nr:translation elongation factor Ts [Dehalococcoidia bacterium]
MAISVDDIKSLREQTGAGVMDCRNALNDADGDVAKAVEVLREKGFAKAEKRSDREISEGRVEAYIHGGRIGVMVEINCETDFVARTDVFKNLAHDVAMQIASMGALVVREEDIPADAEGTPEELALLNQPFIKDPSKTIRDLIAETVTSTGER